MRSRPGCSSSRSPRRRSSRTSRRRARSPSACTRSAARSPSTTSAPATARLTYLKQIPVDYLKLDIEFVRDLTTNSASRHVVQASSRWRATSSCRRSARASRTPPRSSCSRARRRLRAGLPHRAPGALLADARRSRRAGADRRARDQTSDATQPGSAQAQAGAAAAASELYLGAFAEADFAGLGRNAP